MCQLFGLHDILCFILHKVIPLAMQLMRLLEANLYLGLHFHETGYSHCDMHAGNLIIDVTLKKPFESAESATKYVENIATNGWLILRKSASPKTLQTPLPYSKLIDAKHHARLKDVEFQSFLITWKSISVIDSAFAVRVPENSSVQSPCRQLSACRADDVVENTKSVDKLVKLGDLLAERAAATQMDR
eukprot:Gregarina_sp_Poly_1__7047@NODE_3847_length_858_cov_11_403287_g2183_i1_p1_GENE_NODE_3847_length_858_cov_11_403287_g2183_i1NODE_3847_length_858_cov_11_403287_g2183_i1_p1_ORF_typecomplete_len188_score30_57WaaY/PF06176_11/0_07WaaY/PF06176_11/3_1e02Pkinase_fungal/PF17667_1/0_071APH/PF01636_23/0_26_NODE_3847_length_858_cov_11_403287_g2183_i1207770